MTFDVGIGKCRSVQSDSVDVWVDGSIVRRLAPETKWQRDGISVLQVPSKLCSTRHRVAVGEEVFLDTGLINANSAGKLDVEAAEREQSGFDGLSKSFRECCEGFFAELAAGLGGADPNWAGLVQAELGWGR